MSDWTNLPPDVFEELFRMNEEAAWRLVTFEAEHEPDRLAYYAELDRAEEHRNAQERKRRAALLPPPGLGRLTLEEALERLEKVRRAGPGRWSARCPVHDDRSPSLLVSENDLRPGAPVFHCFAGCDWRHIMEALKR